MSRVTVGPCPLFIDQAGIPLEEKGPKGDSGEADKDLRDWRKFQGEWLPNLMCHGSKRGLGGVRSCQMYSHFCRLNMTK